MHGASSDHGAEGDSCRPPRPKRSLSSQDALGIKPGRLGGQLGCGGACYAHVSRPVPFLERHAGKDFRGSSELRIRGSAMGSGETCKCRGRSAQNCFSSKPRWGNAFVFNRKYVQARAYDCVSESTCEGMSKKLRFCFCTGAHSFMPQWQESKTLRPRIQQPLNYQQEA